MRSINSALVIVVMLFVTYALVYPGVLEDIEYTIVKIEEMGNIKCSVTVFLKNKATKEQLTEIANNIRKMLGKTYDRVFIVYYFPGMEVGYGAWATSHFNPNLKINIIGSSIEEDKIINAAYLHEDDNIIGRWVRHSVVTQYILRKDNGKIFMIIIYKDNSKSETEMIEVVNGEDTLYREKNGDSYSEDYRINDQGILAIYDYEGFIRALHQFSP